ncbi:transposable element Tcb2 transposase [Trichonephila clavipes]|nr:transposable element Tcb2 transposase [Trichonephila clavipes]
METGWSARRVARQSGHSDYVMGGGWDQWIREMSFTRRPGSGRPLLTKWCLARRNWTATEWKQVIVSDESRFNLSSDGNRVRVWIPRGERLNPAFDLQQHTTPTAGVMLWGAIAYNIISPLVLIRGTMTAQRKGKNAVQARKKLTDVYGEGVLAVRQCQNWFAKFDPAILMSKMHHVREGRLKLIKTR